jgi:hypothetical protein
MSSAARSRQPNQGRGRRRTPSRVSFIVNERAADSASSRVSAIAKTVCPQLAASTYQPSACWPSSRTFQPKHSLQSHLRRNTPFEPMVDDEKWIAAAVKPVNGLRQYLTNVLCELKKSMSRLSFAPPECLVAESLRQEPVGNRCSSGLHQLLFGTPASEPGQPVPRLRIVQGR